MFQKYASAEITGIKASPTRLGRNASLDKFADYDDYRTDDGYIYVRVRAISSRVNKNHDGWPSEELNKSYRTFLGKPIFIDHNNSDPEKSRGVIVDAKIHVEDSHTSGLDPYYSTAPTEHLPPTWIELLLETDAKSFPKLAKAIQEGDIDGVSMGCFLPGAPIVLRDGTRRAIEEISVGDEVLTHEGTLEPVTYTMKRPYSGLVHEITAYGQNEKAVVTDEHPIWIRREDFEGWVEAKDVHKGDYVMTPSRVSDGTNDVTIPAAKLVGYYLAEGNLGRDKNRNTHDHLASIEWNFSGDEVDLVQDVIDCLDECGLKAVGPYHKNNCATVRCNDPLFAWNMQVTAGELSYGKRLADGVFDWSDDALRAMLLAYVAGDGTDKHKNGGVQWSTVSKTLAEQLHLICIRLGIQSLPPAVLIPKQENRRTRYTTNVPESQIENLYAPASVAVAVKNPRAFVENGKLYRKVKYVTSSYYNGDVYNFDVEGADSYVAANMAVHNCNVEKSKCSHCGNWATNPDEYCQHIRNKGAEFDFYRNGQKTSKSSYEDCYDIGFFEISYVFDPADETASVREIRSSVEKTACEKCGCTNCDSDDGCSCGKCPGCDSKHEAKTSEYKYVKKHGDKWVITQKNTGKVLSEHDSEDQAKAAFRAMEMSMHGGSYGGSRLARLVEGDTDQIPQSEMTVAPEKVDTLRQEQVCPICGSMMEDGICSVCNFEEPPEGFGNPDLTKAQDTDDMQQQQGLEAEDAQQDSMQVQDAQQQGQMMPGQPGQQQMAASYNRNGSSGVTGDKVSADLNGGRVNTREKPILPVVRQTTDKPKAQKTISDSIRPVESSIQEEKMSDTQKKTADTNAGEELAGGIHGDGNSKRVDVEAVGGVDGNENPPGHKTVEVTGVGGVVSDDGSGEHVEVDKGLLNEVGDHTDTWSGNKGDSAGQQSPVTGEKPVLGSEHKSLQILPAPEPEKVVDVTADVANEVGGPTATWGGDSFHLTDPVTTEAFPVEKDGPVKNVSDGDGNVPFPRSEEGVKPENSHGGDGSDEKLGAVRAHFMASLKLAEEEIALGITPEEAKYDRLAELETESPEAVQAQLNTISRVKTAGLAKKVATVKRPAPSFQTQSSLRSEPDEQDVDAEAIFS